MDMHLAQPDLRTALSTAELRVQELSDSELVRACAAGQEAAATELMRRYQGPLYRFLSRFLVASDDIEQATLSVFVRAWQHAPRFQYRSKVSTWLYRIAANLAHDLHSRRLARPREEPWDDIHDLAGGAGNAEHDALKRLERAEISDTLARALARLSESDRLILVLYYFEERTYEEIEEIAGFSYTVLKTRLTRARQRLRSLLDRESEGESYELPRI